MVNNFVVMIPCSVFVVIALCAYAAQYESRAAVFSYVVLSNSVTNVYVKDVH